MLQIDAPAVGNFWLRRWCDDEDDSVPLATPLCDDDDVDSVVELICAQRNRPAPHVKTPSADLAKNFTNSDGTCEDLPGKKSCDTLRSLSIINLENSAILLYFMSLRFILYCGQL